MTAPKRNSWEREKDRRDVAHMYYDLHLSQPEIAHKLNTDPKRSYTLSQVTISNDLKAVRERFIKAAHKTIERARAEELSRIARLEATYWQAWVESQTITTVTGGIDGEGATVRQQDGPGNPAFLSGVERCINMRDRILGVDAPKVIQVVDEDFDQAKWHEEREKRHAAALEMLVEDEDGSD